MFYITNEKIKFLDVGMGQIFYAHDSFWVRTDYDVGTKVESHSGDRGSARNFTIDACDRYVYAVVL